MDLVTQAKYAKKLGVTRGAINNAVKRGDLRTVEQGKKKLIDLHDMKTIQYSRNKNPQRTGSPPAQTENSPTDGKGSGDASSSDSSGSNGGEGSDDSLQTGPTSYELKDERVKTQTATEKMKLAKEMGVLIYRKMVDKLFDRLYAVILNHFHPLSDRLASVVADIAGVTDHKVRIEIKEKIDEEVARALNEFKREARNASSRLRP